MPVRKSKRGGYEFTLNYSPTPGIYKQKYRCGYKTKKEALVAMQQLADKLQTGCTITFAALVDNYLIDAKVRRKVTTYHTARTVIDKHILPFFAKYQVQDITPLTIRQWQNGLLRQGYQDTYLAAVNARLSAILNYAIAYYGLQRNPVKSAGRFGRRRSKEMRCWSYVQFKQFLAVIDQKADYPYYVAFNILFLAGLREGELLALTPRDVDTENGKIRVNKNYVRLHGRDIIQSPKTTKSNRNVAIPQHLCHLLDDYCSRLVSPDQRLFFCISKFGLFRAMRRFSHKSGLEPIRIHDLRHSYASNLIALGVPILQISQQMGHESPAITLSVYAHLINNQQDEAAKALDRLIDGRQDDVHSTKNHS